MQNKITSQQFAAKLFIKSKYLAKPDGKFSIENEICMLRNVAHPNILSIYEVFETQHSIYLITNFLQGKSLFNYLEQNGKMTEPQIQRLMKQVLETEKYLFEKKIMHRDIKLQNLIFDQQDVAKANLILIDFGLATTFDTNKLPIYPRCGTPGFVAPEIANNKESNVIYDGKCDAFSIGCVFHAMLFGKYAFTGISHNEVFKKNKECKIDFEDQLYNKITNQAKDLLMKLLVKEPDQRITVKEALCHQFFAISENQQSSLQSYSNSLNNNSTLKTFSISNNDQDNFNQQSSENQEWKNILKQCIEKDQAKIDYIKEEIGLDKNKNCFQDQMSCQQTLASSYKKDDQTNISTVSGFIQVVKQNKQKSDKKEKPIFEPPQNLQTESVIVQPKIDEQLTKIPLLMDNTNGPNDSEQSSPFSPVFNEEYKFGNPLEHQNCIQLMPLNCSKQFSCFNQPIKIATLPFIKQTQNNNVETQNHLKY